MKKKKKIEIFLKKHWIVEREWDSEMSGRASDWGTDHPCRFCRPIGWLHREMSPPTWRRLWSARPDPCPISDEKSPNSARQSLQLHRGRCRWRQSSWNSCPPKGCPALPIDPARHLKEKPTSYHCIKKLSLNKMRKSLERNVKKNKKKNTSKTRNSLQSPNRRIAHSINQSTDASPIQSINQSIDRSWEICLISQPNNQSINRE